MELLQSARTHVANRVFSLMHRNNIVYNTCWEDPAVDRQALNLTERDRLLVITSAGCNALDYLLAGCGEVHAVDVNPLQNALLELKCAAIATLDFDDFNLFFGQGRHPFATRLYRQHLRPVLSNFARAYWDRRISLFCAGGWRDSFYYRGCSGFLAKSLIFHLFRMKSLRTPLELLTRARSLDDQRRIYNDLISEKLWTKSIEWLVSRDMTTNLMGVPRAQREQMSQQYPGGIPQYIRDSLEFVLTKLSFRENYFYRVYLEGGYPPDCRPEYLKAEHFSTLRGRLRDLSIHTATVTEFLRHSSTLFSRFVLLDHMDWMSNHQPLALKDEWNAIIARASPGARILYRSASVKVNYLDTIPVRYKGEYHRLGNLLTQHQELAKHLHQFDRVHTYASFHIADLPS